jgi:hypothetical protein
MSFETNTLLKLSVFQFPINIHYRKEAGAAKATAYPDWGKVRKNSGFSESPS